MEPEKVKGIVIDPDNQTIEEVTFPNNLDGYYELLGCDLIDHYPYDENNELILDDEGLLKEQHSCFSVVGINGYFVGKAVIVGVNHEDGSWIDHSVKQLGIKFFKEKEKENAAD